MRLRELRSNFLVRFLAFALLFVLIWEPISIIYLHFISFLTGLFFGLIDHSVTLYVESDILKMQYPSLGGELLTFSMREPDEIFRNCIVLAALICGSYRVSMQQRLKYAAISLGILFLMHMVVVYMYTLDTVWAYVEGLPDADRAAVAGEAQEYFPLRFAGLFRYVIFNWNSWGWDLIPLLLWLPVGFKQFSYLFPSRK